MSSENEKPLKKPPRGGNNKYTRVNRSGRPKSGESIKFAPQPKSLIISQLLREAKEKILKNDQLLTNSPITQDTKETKNEAEDSLTSPEKILKQTQKKISNLFSCDYPDCTYSCKLSCNLIKHKRKHTCEKPYICHKCTFRTNYINSLKVHQRLHSNDRPFTCKQCSYKCNSSSNLKKHSLHRHSAAIYKVDNEAKQ